MAFLQLLRGNKPSDQYELTKDVTVLGRNPDCDVWVNLGAVSREHAQILKIDGKFYVKDLKSRNQTFVNEKQVKPEEPPVLLNDQDKIRICDFVCVFEEPGEEPPSGDGSQTVMSTIMARNSVSLEAQPAERLRALLDITTSLTRTLEIESLLPRILDNLFDVFRAADRGFVLVRDEATKQFRPKSIKTRRPTDETKVRFSKTILNACVDEGRAILCDDATQDKQFAMSASVADFKIRSVMCAPLHSAEGETFGVIQIDTQDRSKKFTQDDLQFLVAVCNQAAVAMENAKLHEGLVLREKMLREIELAVEVQRTFLPKSVPEQPGYGFFAHYQAAREVGGDYYGFVRLPDGKLAIAIGDVAGKGIPAALFMARLSGDVRYALLSETDPARVVCKLNAQLQEAGLTDRFVTFTLALLDPQTHHVTFVNAGHVPPLIRRAKTGELEEIAAGELNGLPLGVMEGYEYVSCDTDLEPGDCVFLCSDGILDATNKAQVQFGSERLRSTLKACPAHPAEFGQRALDVVQQHAAGSPDQFDDMTLVSFGRES